MQKLCPKIHLLPQDSQSTCPQTNHTFQLRRFAKRERNFSVRCHAPVKVKLQGGGASGDPGGLDVYIQPVGWELDSTWQPGGGGN